MNSHLPLPHQHDVLHHAGAARNRQHSDDEPERQAESHRGAEVLPPRGRPLQAEHPPVRDASIASRARTTRFRCSRPTGWAVSTCTRRARSCWPRDTTTSRTCSMCPAKTCDKVLHYYKEPHPYYNHDVAVIGAKNSAAIAALELWWTGARVTSDSSRRRNLGPVKYWIKPNIENRIKNGEIRGYFHSSVVSKFCRIRFASPPRKARFRSRMISFLR